MLQSDGFFERVCEALGLPNVYGVKTKIAKIAGISSNAVGLWEAGQMPGRNTLEPIARIADHSNASIHWLLTGEGSHFLDEGSERPPVGINPKLLDKLRTIAHEQAPIVFADLDIAAGTLPDRSLAFLVDFLLYRALVNYNLINDEDLLLSAADRRRAQKLTFIANAPQSLDDRVRELVKQEMAKTAREDVGGEVGPIEDADMILAPVVAHIGPGKSAEEIENELRTIEDKEVAEIEKRLRPRKRKMA